MNLTINKHLAAFGVTLAALFAVVPRSCGGRGSGLGTAEARAPDALVPFARERPFASEP